MSELERACQMAVHRASAAAENGELDFVDLGLMFVGFDVKADDATDMIERHAHAMAQKIAEGQPWAACLMGLYAQGLLAGMLYGQLREERERQAA